MSLYCTNIHRMETLPIHEQRRMYNATKRIIKAVNLLHNFLASTGSDHAFVF